MNARLSLPLGLAAIAAVAGLAVATAASAHGAGAAQITAHGAGGARGHVNLNLPGAASSTGDGSAADPSTLLTSALTDVDGFWTRTLKANGIAEPSVRYAWLPAGQSVQTACSSEPTDDSAAFYCPEDDTMYVSEAFANAVRNSGLSHWPSGDQPSGALGDMAVAYIVAHEEAHNIQAELGLVSRAADTKSLELQADCMAGAWAADAASRGVVDTHDENVGKVTAWLVGDYAMDNPDHHGTPQEREQAFVDGVNDLSSCWAYVS